jgi:hypothetical protein
MPVNAAADMLPGMKQYVHCAYKSLQVQGVYGTQMVSGEW